MSQNPISLVSLGKLDLLCYTVPMDKLLELLKNHTNRQRLFQLVKDAGKSVNPKWMDEDSFRVMAKQHGCTEDEINKFLATIGSEEPECLKNPDHTDNR